MTNSVLSEEKIKIYLKWLLFVGLLLACFFSLSAQVLQVKKSIPLFQNTAKSFEARAMDLVNRMTFEEKIMQLGNNAPAIPRLGIEKYDYWNECLHGVARAGIATVFPQAIGMAASFDRNMMYRTASVISDEARAKHNEAVRNKDYSRYKGLTFWSPNINIYRDPRWGRGQETYGEDPYLTGQMGIQFVKGLQGNDPKYLKVIATAKHFAVHSGPESERHTFNVIPNAHDLWETYLPAFEDLVKESKVYSVMSAYNRVNGKSASASGMLLQDILRNKWSFNGYVVSDCGAIDDIYAHHHIVKSAEEAAALGIRKGCDLNCGEIYQNVLLKSFKKGMIDDSEINLAVYRLMLARMRLGMFDPPEQVKYAQIPFEMNDSPEHDQIALEMAQKSMTLLKNNGILPLDKNKIKQLAVVGPNAENIKVLLGNYHGKASHPVTILQGIKNAAGGKTKVTYSYGCPLVSDKDRAKKDNQMDYQLSAKTIAEVKMADVAIFIGGLNVELEGEENKLNVEGFYRGDRTKIELPEVQLQAIKTMQKTGTPVILVLLSGGAIAFQGIDKDLQAILWGGYPGQRGGNAVADVLFGDYNPAGRLPVTFYASTKQLADFRDYNMSAGNGRTYRFFKDPPLYPFGYGLSYTTFKYSDIKISHNKISTKDPFTVSIKIKNTGKCKGEEVVQLYIRDTVSKTWMPIKQLRGFERIMLGEGEQKTVVFQLNAEKDLRHYDPMLKKYVVVPGAFEIQIGASSNDIRQKTRLIVQ